MALGFFVHPSGQYAQQKRASCDDFGVAKPGGPPAAKRRGLPLWLMPIAVVVGFYLIFVLAGLINGLIGGLVGGLVGGLITAAVAVALVVWMQRRADAYVRSRASSEDDAPSL